MEIINRTRFPDKRVQELIDYVSGVMKCRALIKKVTVRRSRGTGINAWAREDGVVHVALRTGAKRYPLTFKYKEVLGAPPMRFNSFEEALISTLAHEFQHLCQFQSGADISDWRSEMEAEAMATMVLGKWLERR
jgi:hypothetical protein